MAIVRPRCEEASPVAIGNPAVDQALRLWQGRLAQAREEGRQAGLAEAAATLEAAREAEAAAAAQAAAVKDRIAKERSRVVTEIGGALAALQHLVADHERLREAVLRSAEREVVDLGCALAARILRHAVQHDPVWMEDLLTRALALAPDRRRVTLRMHPADAALLEDVVPAAEQRSGLVGAVSITVDDGLGRGACILESGGTTIDAGIASSWTRLREQLLLAAPDDRWQRPVAADDTAAEEGVRGVLESASEEASAGEPTDRNDDASDASDASEAQS